MIVGATGSMMLAGNSLNLWSANATKLIGLQSVRWRKPRWVPQAPSRKFLIPQRRPTDKASDEELRRLNNNYRTAMRSIRRHLFEEHLRTSETSAQAVKQAEEEEAEHQQLMEYNHQENLRVAALREERVRMEHEADLARVKASREMLEMQLLKNEEAAQGIILKTQELVKSFIKREDLQAAIEAAMANPHDYNFAIDQDGHIYRGRSTKPADVPMEEREKLVGSVKQ